MSENKEKFDLVEWVLFDENTKKKGADRCIYLYGALDMPLSDKRKRPTPQNEQQCC